MRVRFLAAAVGAIAVFLMVSPPVDAQLLSSAKRSPAPAPLLAAGIPAFALLGGGVGLRALYRRLSRRS